MKRSQLIAKAVRAYMGGRRESKLVGAARRATGGLAAGSTPPAAMAL